jgi:hypothetical protein
MKWLESIIVHLLFAFMWWIIGGLLILIVMTKIISPTAAFNEWWVMEIWGGICLVFTYFIPSGIAKNRIRYWLHRLTTTKKESNWEKRGHKILSWLDSPLLLPWQRLRLVPRILKEIEPYLRAEGPTLTYRNLLKILFSYPKVSLEIRDQLIMNFLTRGITSLDEANLIAQLWDKNRPNKELGEIWVDYALSQEIDAPWMEPGYLWAMYQGSERGERIARFLLPEMLMRKRRDDLATLVFLRSNSVEPSPEVTKSLQQIAQYYVKIQRNDSLSQRVKAAITGIEIPEEIIEKYREPVSRIPTPKLKPKVRKPAPPKFAPIADRIFQIVLKPFQWLYQTIWKAIQGLRLRIILQRFAILLSIGILVVVAILVGIRYLETPEPASKPVPPDYSVMQIYHSNLRFTIQVAAYRDQAQAEQMVSRLRSLGEEAYWQKTDGDRPWYRIRVGSFSTQGEAKNYAESLLAKKLITNYYVANFSDGYYRNP